MKNVDDRHDRHAQGRCGNCFSNTWAASRAAQSRCEGWTAGVRPRLFWRNLRGAGNRPLLAEAVWKHPETSTADNHFIGISRSPMSRFIEGEACSKDLLFPERLDDWIEEGRAAGCGSAAKLRDHALWFLPNVSERRQLLGCLGVSLSRRAVLAKVKLAGDAPYLYEKAYATRPNGGRGCWILP